MVCSKCEKKLKGVVCPDVWKDGAKNTIQSGGRKLNENKLLTHRHNPYSRKVCATKGCKAKIEDGYKYCQNCAYKKGLCAMCGKKILDTSSYKQTIV